MPHRLIGVMDVGGSHVTAALLDASATMRERRDGPLDSSAPRELLLEQLLAPARELARPGLSWAVALPGPFDYPAGVGTFAGVAKFGSIAGLDLRGPLSAALDTRPSEVRFVNDAIAYGIGEWTADAERAARFVCITLGTGVGSSFLDRGMPVESGAEVPPHGWVFLIEVDGLPLERSVSTAAIIAAYREASGEARPVHDIAAAALGGDPVAAGVFERAMQTLGAALAPYVSRFATDELVIGGGMARSWALIEEPLRAGLSREHPHLAALRMRPALLGDEAPLIGAADWARRTAEA